MVEQKNRKFLKRIAYFYLLNQTVFVIILIFSFYYLFTGNDVWLLPFPFDIIIPFINSRTILGWYLLWCIQFCMSSFYAWTMISITSYFISCCLYITAVCDHFNMVIDSIKFEIKGNQHDNDGSNDQKIKRNVKQTLSQAIEIHVKIFEWVTAFQTAQHFFSI